MGKVSASWIADNEEVKINMWAIIRGVLRGVFVTLLGIGFLMMGASISEAKVFYFSDFLTIIVILSLLFGGLKAGLVTGKKGWLHGIIVSLGYLALLFIVSVLFFPLNLSIFDVLIQVLSMSMIGALGGIIGVNIKDYNLRQEARRTRLKETYWTYNKNQLF